MKFNLTLTATINVKERNAHQHVNFNKSIEWPKISQVKKPSYD